MKRKPKTQKEEYSFEEYRNKFSPPPPEPKKKISDNPFELGVKLAHESLAKLREHTKPV